MPGRFMVACANGDTRVKSRLGPLFAAGAAIACCCLSAAPAGAAVTKYTVTFTSACVIDGVLRKPLTLVRGSTYAHSVPRSIQRWRIG